MISDVHEHGAQAVQAREREDRESVHMAYCRQLEATRTAVNRLQEEVSALEAKLEPERPLPKEAELNDPRVARLYQMSAQLEVARKIFTLMLAQASKHELWGLYPKSGAERAIAAAERGKFYSSATGLLRTIQQAAEDTLAVDERKWKPVSERSLRSLWEEHPRKIKLGFVGGAIFGKWLVQWSVLGEVLAGVGGGLAGAGLTALLLLGAVCVLEGLRQWLYGAARGETHVQEERRKLEAMLDDPDAQVLSDEVLEQLESMFRKTFLAPLAHVIDDSSCLICFEHFPADGGVAAERPVKAPDCTCAARFHAKCLRGWRRSGMRLAASCPMCRQTGA